MRSEAMEKLDVFVGSWRTTLRNAWFLEPADQEVPGSATGEWLSDAFVVLRWRMQGDVGDATSEMVLVLGRSDANDAYTALYHDERGVCRVFPMTFEGSQWNMTREDPDMFQRFIADVGPDRIDGRWEASEDQGATWRKDFDLVFERAGQEAVDPGPFFHGTKAALEPGDLLAPGYSSNYGERITANFVYLTATLDAATWGAELAEGPDPGRIYRVEPTGPFENDPNLTDKRFPGNPTRSYRTRHPVRVVEEVLDWQGHSEAELQTMRDHLAELERLGIEAINE